MKKLEETHAMFDWRADATGRVRGCHRRHPDDPWLSRLCPLEAVAYCAGVHGAAYAAAERLGIGYQNRNLIMDAADNRRTHLSSVRNFRAQLLATLNLSEPSL